MQNLESASLSTAVAMPLRSVLLLIIVLTGSRVGCAGPSGEEIYRTLCASCHGASGEGTNDQYPQPLIGDRSIRELADYIDKTMPEKEPQKCVGEDARKVAEYMHGAFYSPIAQARIRPPRIDLSRLTVRQYRNSVADLVGSFRRSEPWTSQRGLTGEYFHSRRRRGERVLSRIDPIVDFQFGTGSPDPAIKPEEFVIQWDGAVLAPDTGEYEFILLTENGAKLWVNDSRKPLIDAAVKSGKDVTDRRESLRLLGGRIYPLRLEVFKSKEAKESRASIVLKWKPPHRAEEIIPTRCLLPQRVAETFVLQTPFPPDDRSMGYERGTSVSKDWEQATMDSAVEVAAAIEASLPELSETRRDAGDRTDRYRKFCERFVERAWGRPLTAELQADVIERQFAEAQSPEQAVQRIALLTLQSPRFLFPELGQPEAADGNTIARRLALILCDSIPDGELRRAAQAGELSHTDQVRRQAERLVQSPAARAKLREFLLQWLKVDHFSDLSKDSHLYPEFTPAIVSDLRTSLDLFLEEIIHSPDADYRQLLLSEGLYLNGPLATFYGVDLPADALTPGRSEFQKVSPRAGERSGVLTHPYLMAGFSYNATSSPIHRGVFLARSVLGRTLRAPPEAVAPLAPSLHADLTTRERVLLQTRPEVCQTCHSLINPLGFTLEHFDPVGRYRETEHGRRIDASGSYLTRNGDAKQFQNIQELAAFLVESDETPSAFVDQLFHNLVKQPIRAYGLQIPDELRGAFVAHRFNMRQLMVDIAVQAATLTLSPVSKEVP